MLPLHRLFSLNAVSSIRIDTAPPLLDPTTGRGIRAVSPDGTYYVGDTILIDVFFTERIVVTGSPRLWLKVGASSEL